MSAYMGRELVLLARSFWCGALLLFFYDGIRIFRRLVPHRSFLTAMEDLLFGTGSGIWLCVQVFQASQGVLRGYFLAGVILGGAAWHFSLSRIFVEKLTAILQVPIKKILILLKWLKFYARRGRISLYRRMRPAVEKTGKCWKNRQQFRFRRSAGTAELPPDDRGDGHGRQKKSQKKKKKADRRKAGGAEQGSHDRHQCRGHHASGSAFCTGTDPAETDPAE